VGTTLRASSSRAFLVLVALLLGCIAWPQAASAQSLLDKLRDAKDKVKETARETKQKIEEKKRHCVDCGKECLGERCNACDVKRAKEAAAKAAEQAKQKWRDSEPQRRAIEEKVREAPGKAREAGAKAVERTREAWRDTADERQKLKGTLKSAAGEVRAASTNVYQNREEIARNLSERSRQTWERARSVAQEDIAKIREVVTDPEVQRQAIEALDAAIVLRQQWKDAEREMVYSGLKTVGGMTIQTKNGRMTVEDACRQRIVERFPALVGTDVVNDPALVVTAVVTKDREYFVREMKIVPVQGGSVSLVEAIDRTTAFNASKTLAVLDLLEATENLQQAAATGEGGLDAVIDLRVAMQGVQRFEKR